MVGHAGGRSSRMTGLNVSFFGDFFARRLRDQQRNRNQGSSEFLLHYYYDIIDLCKSINADMPEREKIYHLLSGLRPSLVKKIGLLQLAACADLLEKAKLFLRAEEMVQVQSEFGGYPT